MDHEIMAELADIKRQLRALAIHVAILMVVGGLILGLLVGNTW